MNRIEIIRHLEEKYPPDLAYEWDNVGLMVGSLNKRVRRVLLTLDVTKDVVKEAIDKKIDLIISHHPFIFTPITAIKTETPKGWIIEKLIKKGITVYSAHTNFDQAEGGMNDVLASAVGLKHTRLLDIEANIGRIGEIDAMTYDAFATHVKSVLDINHIRIINPKSSLVERVAISGGSGIKHMHAAKMKRADVFLTGDVDYHSAVDAKEMGLSMMDIGHVSEKIFKTHLKKELDDRFPDCEILLSDIEEDPFEIR